MQQSSSVTSTKCDKIMNHRLQRLCLTLTISAALTSPIALMADGPNFSFTFGSEGVSFNVNNYPTFYEVPVYYHGHHHRHHHEPSRRVEVIHYHNYGPQFLRPSHSHHHKSDKHFRKYRRDVAKDWYKHRKHNRRHHDDDDD